MKPYYLLFLLLLGGLIFVILKPQEGHIQAEQEAPRIEKLSRNTYRVRMEYESSNDQPVADILWMQKAAEVASSKNIPWFNVIEQKVDSHSMEGVIELVQDPMRGEFDANEILSLQLSNEVPQ